jgi:putative ABC transport system substrate-binding protein
MKRREFITLLGGATAWPLAARAQRSERMRRVGVLFGSASDAAALGWMAAFQQELQEMGWTNNRNVYIDSRFAGGDVDRMRAQAAELVGMPADVIVASGTLQVHTLQQLTHTIPIVFVQASDPVGDGFVASLARPGGNATGFPNVESSMSSKWLELLKEAAPRTERIAVVFHPDASPRRGAFFLGPAETAAAVLGVMLVRAPIRDDQSIEASLKSLAQEPGAGIIVTPDSFVFPKRDLIIATAARHHLPAVYPFREFAASGGLISYGAVSIDLYRRAASYVNRILNGEKPADLPVQLPTKFELVINLNTAKVLGLDVPPMLLARADEVIE